jgi:copper chaperone NosL
MKHSASRWLIATVLLAASLWAGVGCGKDELRPVELFPEDNCAHCRMAISDPHFASEIIDQNGETYKFDDLGCMLAFKSRQADLMIAGIFLKEYETLGWIPYERASIVTTGISTPMGSGHVAFSRADKAREFQKSHPAIASAVDTTACCEE